MTTTKLGDYANGNCRVRIYSDGTKVIDYASLAKPDYPLSIDLKITNQCNHDCPWCHEDSRADGSAANFGDVLRILDDLPMHTEVAIGGGNALGHGDLETILEAGRAKNLICNLTVHAEQFVLRRAFIIDLLKAGLIYGLGISWSESYAMSLSQWMHPNTVFHFIAGKDRVEDLLDMLHSDHKCLILGYKTFGRGMTYANENKLTLDKWRLFTGAIIEAGHVSFDTLATEQLDVQRFVRPSIWESHFMGNDGEFTMYVDAVKMEYAKSSTSPRRPLNNMTIKEAFATIRSEL